MKGIDARRFRAELNPPGAVEEFLVELALARADGLRRLPGFERTYFEIVTGARKLGTRSPGSGVLLSFLRLMSYCEHAVEQSFLRLHSVLSDLCEVSAKLHRGWIPARGGAGGRQDRGLLAVTAAVVTPPRWPLS